MTLYVTNDVTMQHGDSNQRNAVITASYVHIVYQGAGQDTYYIRFNRSTDTWSSPVKVFDTNVAGDYHSYPALLRDSNGYLHVWGGAHNGAMEYRSSASADDGSSWSTPGDVPSANTNTYPVPLQTNGKMYLFCRKGSPGDQPYALQVYSIPNLDTGDPTALRAHTLIEQTVGEEGDYVPYSGSTLIDPLSTNDVHLILYQWTTGDASIGFGTLMHWIYDVSTEKLYERTKTTEYTVLPATPDAASKFYTAKKVEWINAQFDSSGNLHAVFITASKHDAEGYLYYTKWDRSSWSTPVQLAATGTPGRATAGIQVYASNNIDVLYVRGLATGTDAKGESIWWLHWNGTTWTNKLVLATDGTTFYGDPVPITGAGASDEAQWVFSGENLSDSGTTTFPLYVWSTQGFLQSDGTIGQAPALTFPTGWGRKCAITVSSANVTGGPIAGMPVLLTEANFPAEMMSGGGNSAQNGGGDIRFTENADGTGPIACEVVSFVTGGSPSAQVWVRWPVLSSTENKTIYVWYGHASESQPAITAANDDGFQGANYVWCSYKCVLHCEEASGSLTDKSTLAKTFTAVGSPTYSQTGQIKSGIAMGGGGTACFTSGFSSQFYDVVIGYTMQMWTNLAASGSQPSFAALWAKGDSTATGTNSIQRNGTTDTLRVYHNNTSVDLTNVMGSLMGAGQKMLHVTWNGITDALTAYVDGASAASTTHSTNPATTTEVFYFGASRDGGVPAVGTLDEFRWTKGVRSSDWIATEYVNQSSPSTFAAEGSPTNPDGSSDNNSVGLVSGKLTYSVLLGGLAA